MIGVQDKMILESVDIFIILMQWDTDLNDETDIKVKKPNG